MTELVLNEAERLLFEELKRVEEAMEGHYATVYERLASHLGQSLLEVGSGTGVMSKFLVAHGAPIILTDYHPVYLAELRARFGGQPHVRFQLLDLDAPRYALDEGAPPIDTIVCQNVLEHIADDGHVLAEFARLLPAGGRLLLQVPNYPALFGSLDAAYGHCRRYARRGLERLLDAHGFEVRWVRPFNVLGIPGWIVSSKILRLQRLNVRSIRLYNSLVPLSRRLDALLPFAGLALLAYAVRR